MGMRSFYIPGANPSKDMTEIVDLAADRYLNSSS